MRQKQKDDFHVDCDYELSYNFDPKKTAVLSIDFQTDFLSPEGMCESRGLPTSNLRKIVPRAGALLNFARNVSLTIIHTRECYKDDLSDLNPFRSYRDGIIGEPGPLGRFLVCTEKGSEIIPEMAPIAGERVIDKAGFNAFYGTELHKTLQDAGITHVIIMGITAQCCVSSTLRGAVDHGYFPLVVRDCCAAYDEEDLDASIRVIYSENHNFGWVAESEKVLNSIANER